jgi:predicted phage baseplate assembly protein
VEFDFLPKLPSSNLDDRNFDDLVEECVLRIPRYCQEWTDYNLSDPGITLIELFAWLTDRMLLRFNQVPRKNYVAFLELLGIRLQPPTPAQTNLTFYLPLYPKFIPSRRESKLPVCGRKTRPRLHLVPMRP